MDVSGVPWNDKNDALIGHCFVGLSIFRQLFFFPNRGRIGKFGLLLAVMSFSNVSISSVSCATLALSPEMLVSSVEILALSAAICSSEVT